MISFQRIFECSFLALALAAGAQAGERVVLVSGFEIHADRHEDTGDTVRLFEGAGSVDVPKAMVAEYRVEEYVPPAAAAAAPASASPVQAGAPISAPAAQRLETRQHLIEAAVKKDGVADPAVERQLAALVDSVMRQESGYRANAISPKGAIGLMQLMPGTARQLGVDPRDPADNVNGGAKYLTELLKKYQGRDDQVVRALAAYNAGPGAVDKYNGVPPYRETRDYVRRVARHYLDEQKQAAN